MHVDAPERQLLGRILSEPDKNSQLLALIKNQMNLDSLLLLKLFMMDVTFDTLPCHDLIDVESDLQFWFCCHLLLV